MQLSSIVLFELRYGIERSAEPARNRAVLDEYLTVPVKLAKLDDDDAAEAGRLRAELARAGTPSAVRRPYRGPGALPRVHARDRQHPGVQARCRLADRGLDDLSASLGGKCLRSIGPHATASAGSSHTAVSWIRRTAIGRAPARRRAGMLMPMRSAQCWLGQMLSTTIVLGCWPWRGGRGASDRAALVAEADRVAVGEAELGHGRRGGAARSAAPRVCARSASR